MPEIRFSSLSCISSLMLRRLSQIANSDNIVVHLFSKRPLICPDQGLFPWFF